MTISRVAAFLCLLGIYSSNAASFLVSPSSTNTKAQMTLTTAKIALRDKQHPCFMSSPLGVATADVAPHEQGIVLQITKRWLAQRDPLAMSQSALVALHPNVMASTVATMLVGIIAMPPPPVIAIAKRLHFIDLIPETGQEPPTTSFWMMMQSQVFKAQSFVRNTSNKNNKNKNDKQHDDVELKEAFVTLNVSPYQEEQLRTLLDRPAQSMLDQKIIRTLRSNILKLAKVANQSRADLALLL